MTAAMPNRRTVLRGLAAADLTATVGSAAGADVAGAATKPNIIVVLIDDLARRELGCYGNTFNETPAHGSPRRGRDQVRGRLRGGTGLLADPGQHHDRAEPGARRHHGVPRRRR